MNGRKLSLFGRREGGSESARVSESERERREEREKVSTIIYVRAGNK